jgi:predicted N-formylglutamate amidohydrolase
MRKQKIIFTCEHATNKIPKKFATFFQQDKIVRGPWGKEKIKNILNEHWGFDPGALTVSKFLKWHFSAPLMTFPMSRLLIEPDNTGNALNDFFVGTVIKSATREEKEKIYIEYWIPYIMAINGEINKIRRSAGVILHFGIHTFTPVKNNIHRHADIGILYDTKRLKERKIAHDLQKILKGSLPNCRIRLNYPYEGRTPGMTNYFRKKFSDNDYRGFEIEINNRHVWRKTKEGGAIMKALAVGIDEVIKKY